MPTAGCARVVALVSAFSAEKRAVLCAWARAAISWRRRERLPIYGALHNISLGGG
jgi:hypothetical protein